MEGGRRYLQTILSEPKFLGRIDKQIFLPTGSTATLTKARYAMKNIDIGIAKMFLRLRIPKAKLSIY